MNNAS